MIDIVERFERIVAEQRRKAPQRVTATLLGESESNARASTKPIRMPGPSAFGLTSKVMKTGPVSDSAWPEKPLVRQNGVEYAA